MLRHRHAAHCESGVISSLISHHGLPISEPMALGLSNALAFAYLPFIKLNGQPLVAYRLPPRAIIKGLTKRLGVKIRYQKFRDPIRGTEALDEAIEQGRAVGLQTSVFWLPYMPEDMRFHFNAHNLIVYGRQGKEYLVSDPVFEEPVTIRPRDLLRARFAKGALAPKGMMYYLDSVPDAIDYERVIPDAVMKNTRVMTKAPLPIIGIRGIRYLARKIARIDRDFADDRDRRLFLGHIVRMQEEIGTGGAGFRFIYASFLQEAGQQLSDSVLMEASEMMTSTGDSWRDFAFSLAQLCRNNSNLVTGAPDASTQLLACCEQEAEVWRLLQDWAKKKR